MKKVKYSLLFLIAFIFACENSLDIAPDSANSTADFFQTEKDLEQALIGAYDAMQSTGQYGLNFIYLMEVRSDNSYSRSITNSGGKFGDVELFRMQPTNSILDESWKACYQSIQRSNTVINRTEAIDIAQSDKDRIKGEAQFIRALTYFNMVQIWGDIPLLIEEVTDPFEYFSTKRSAVAEIYTQIERDLNDAISNLPVDNEDGRADRGAALSLLGKVLLTQHKYADAIATFEAVMNIGKYELLNSYADIFKTNNENNAESIFEIQYDGNGSGEGSAYANYMAIDASLVGNIGSVNGDNIPSTDLISKYVDDDLRKEVNIGFFNSAPYCAKYIETPFQNGDGDKNFIVLRYADVLLSYAEALNQSNFQSSGAALNALNQVRTRAGLQAYTSNELATQEAFQHALMLERQLELAFENHRWFDLLRTGNALEVMNGHPLLTGATGNVQSYQLLYPIPQSQIDASGNVITQNEGY